MMNYEKEENIINSALNRKFINTIEFSTWTQLENGEWILIFNKNNQHDEVSENIVDRSSKSQNLFKLNSDKSCDYIKFSNQFLNKKPKLGSLVMTPQGIGSLIKSENKICSVKFTKENSIGSFPEELVVTEFPIYVKLILSNDSMNCYRINIPANGEVSLIKEIMQNLKVFNSEEYDFCLIYKGEEISESISFIQLPSIRSGDKFLISGFNKTEYKLSRFTALEEYWYCNPDAIIFSVNKKIKLSGLGLYVTNYEETQTGSLSIFEMTGPIRGVHVGRRGRGRGRGGHSSRNEDDNGESSESLIYDLQAIIIPYNPDPANRVHKTDFSYFLGVILYSKY
jgi:hypothetical protein